MDHLYPSSHKKLSKYQPPRHNMATLINSTAQRPCKTSPWTSSGLTQVKPVCCAALTRLVKLSVFQPPWPRSSQNAVLSTCQFLSVSTGGHFEWDSSNMMIFWFDSRNKHDTKLFLSDLFPLKGSTFRALDHSYRLSQMQSVINDPLEAQVAHLEGVLRTAGLLPPAVPKLCRHPYIYR